MTGACALLVEAEAVIRITGGVAATAAMGARAVTIDLPPHLRTEIAAGTTGIATVQMISTRVTTAVEGEDTTQG